MELKDVAEMKRMRNCGWTYQQIADYFGVSKQYVHQLIPGNRRKEDYYEQIPYKGLYKLFQNKSLTVPKFCATVFHHHGHTFVSQMTRFISGGDSRISISQIRKILDYCNCSFEEVFALRSEYKETDHEQED